MCQRGILFTFDMVGGGLCLRVLGLLTVVGISFRGLCFEFGILWSGLVGLLSGFWFVGLYGTTRLGFWFEFSSRCSFWLLINNLMCRDLSRGYRGTIFWVCCFWVDFLV